MRGPLVSRSRLAAWPAATTCRPIRSRNHSRPTCHRGGSGIPRPFSSRPNGPGRRVSRHCRRSLDARSRDASALGMSRREMLGERQVAAPLMTQRAAHGALRLAHRRFQPGHCVSIKLAGLRRSGKPQRPSQCQFGHEPLVLAFALFAPAASRPGQHRAMRRRCGRQVAPCGHASTVRQRFVRLVQLPPSVSPGPAGGGRPSLFQPAVVGMAAGDVAAGDVASGGVRRRMPPMAGLAPASMVVVTGPAELPFSQAGQDSCQ